MNFPNNIFLHNFLSFISRCIANDMFKNLIKNTSRCLILNVSNCKYRGKFNIIIETHSSLTYQFGII